MPINKNAYKRYRIIDCLLRHNQYPSKKIIMEKLEEEGYPISGATFEKDIETMRSKMELNIIYDRYKNGYAYGSNDIHFDIVFTDEELELI